MSAPTPFTCTSITQSISATASASTSVALPGKGNTLRIVNEGPNIAFVSVGTGTQTATLPASSTPVNTCTPVLPLSDIALTIPNDQVYNISAICRGSQTAALSIQVGEGI